MCDTWKYFGFHVRKKLSRVTIRINALNFCLPITVIIRYFKLSVARLIINHDEFVPGTMCTGHGLKLSSTSPLRHWHRRRSHRQSNCEPFAHVFFFPQLAPEVLIFSTMLLRRHWRWSINWSSQENPGMRAGGLWVERMWFYWMDDWDCWVEIFRTFTRFSPEISGLCLKIPVKTEYWNSGH